MASIMSYFVIFLLQNIHNAKVILSVKFYKIYTLSLVIILSIYRIRSIVYLLFNLFDTKHMVLQYLVC